MVKTYQYEVRTGESGTNGLFYMGHEDLKSESFIAPFMGTVMSGEEAKNLPRFSGRFDIPKNQSGTRVIVSNYTENNPFNIASKSNSADPGNNNSCIWKDMIQTTNTKNIPKIADLGFDIKPKIDGVRQPE